MTINLKNYFVISILILSASSLAQNNVFGDVTSNFGILASTYTNTSSETSITGDVGYTTGPAIPAIVDGVIHKSDSMYSQAGTAQNTATSLANSQVCTENLGTSVDLSLVRGGVYTPGVYCTTGDTSIGIDGIILSGNGIYIFKIDGKLTTATNSVVTLNGAQASNISWVPTAATTLGENSKFAGIILDASGVTMSNNVDLTGRVLAFGGTVSTNNDTIIVTSSAMSDAISGNFGILASTYTNTLPGTSIAGDLGYVRGPQVAATVNGVIHTSDAVYSQAGIAQNTATAFTNSQVCTTNLPGIAVDLSQVHDGVYTPGVYCITGAASIGAAGITLSGNGIYIFKIDGALTTVANSNVVLTNGAKASIVFWVPTAATTLGENSNFAGMILDASGVTISNNVSILGKVLAFGGTVSTSADTITVPLFELADATSGTFSCTITFPTGTIDLGSNVQYPDKVYPPDVYCIDGTANIGSGPITLTGNGAHIFKIGGALNQAANTDVILTNGAQGASVIWIPTGPTTIGANSHLIGTVNGAPITIGANSDINGIGPAKTMADETITPSGPLYATGDTTVPEFGTVATMILAIAIVSIIAVSTRTRLGIMSKS